GVRGTEVVYPRKPCAFSGRIVGGTLFPGLKPWAESFNRFAAKEPDPIRITIHERPLTAYCSLLTTHSFPALPAFPAIRIAD
ncbi:MAG TPA: hypothetical protein VFO40_20730, partial [Chthoniobacterales bacterium]|nr:hypothetical protein [Chthoniobacterales bacterium]